METRTYTVVADHPDDAIILAIRKAKAENFDPIKVTDARWLGQPVPEELFHWEIDLRGDPISESELRALAGDR